MARTQECDWGYAAVPDEASMEDHLLDGGREQGSAVWVPLQPGVRRGVVIVFHTDPWYGAYGFQHGIGLYEFPSPAGIDFAPAPRVRSLQLGSSYIAGCCGHRGGVVADLVDGSTVILPTHKRTSLKLGLPPLKPSYPAVPLSEAVGEGIVEAGNYRLVPLHASGVLCYAEDPAKILWSDAGGRPRGWEVYEPGALRIPRFAVAGQQLMFSGRSPRGFTSAPILAEASATVAKFAYHAAVAKF